jgi:AraC-like DNA-binding protein
MTVRSTTDDVPMTVTFRAATEPARSRRDYWQHVVSEAMGPLHLQVLGEVGERDRLVLGDLGPVRVGDLETEQPGGANRRARHLRPSDPDLCKIDVVADGQGVIEQDGRQATLRTGDLAVVDLTRPVRWSMSASRVIAVVFPRSLVPLRRDELDQLTAVTVSGQRGLGSVVSTLARSLADQLPGSDPAAGPRLGTAVVDVFTAVLAGRLDRAVPAANRQRALLLQIQAHVEQRLGDPTLSPSAIAEAHFISVRYLHKLFEGGAETVTGWIRRRRLERCRRDLLDPALRGRPVSAIGARWGMPNPAHFSRAFRAAYGVPPVEFRSCHDHGR